MANIYVRSTDGSDADNGSTWALAKATIAGAAAIDAAGDTIYVSQSHAESVTATALAFAGTPSSPVRVVCGNDGATPPTALATTATITGGTSAWPIRGCLYAYGIAFKNTQGAGGGFTLADDSSSPQTYESCTFELTANDNRPLIGIGGNGSGGAQPRVEFKNSSLKFAHAAQGITVNAASLYVTGGSILSGSTALTGTLFQLSSERSGPSVHVDGFDLSNMGSAASIVNATGTAPSRFVIRNSKLPASWTGSLVSGTHRPGFRAEMYSCDNADTNYKILIADYAGSIIDETVIVRTGGASDGATTISWKMVSTANAKYPVTNLASPEIVVWNETTGSSITVTVEVVTDNVTLTDDECWIEVQYLGTSGYPRSLSASDAKADVLATAANQTTSSASWTTTGLTTPVKQKLAVTFTPQEKGFIQARVVLAKASATVYVDPLLTVS